MFLAEVFESEFVVEVEARVSCALEDVLSVRFCSFMDVVDEEIVIFDLTSYLNEVFRVEINEVYLEPVREAPNNVHFFRLVIFVRTEKAAGK